MNELVNGIFCFFGFHYGKWGDVQKNTINLVDRGLTVSEFAQYRTCEVCGAVSRRKVW